jgi:hypothetical protein
MRHALALLVVCSLATASRADEFDNNPLLASASADTPYAFVTFRPVPPEYFQKMQNMMAPAFAQLQSAGDASKLRGFLAEVGPMTAARFEQLGFNTKARLALYGLGVYPVFRVEISDGDKVLALVQRVAKRWGMTLPAATKANGHRYWWIDDPKDPKGLSVIVAINKTELVAAVGPRKKLEPQLALILGDKKAAKPLTGATFRDIAKRDGYSAQGVGFVDTSRVITETIALDRSAPAAKCVLAIQSLAKRAPRLTAGYERFDAGKMAMGFVLELAPDLLADAKTLTTKLAGVDKLMASKPIFGFAMAADLDRARAFAPRVAGVMRDLGAACKEDDITQAAASLEQVAVMPLPPYLVGLTGGTAALFGFDMSGGGIKKLDAYATIHVADTRALIAALAQQLPAFKLDVDGKPHALPSLFPGVAGHVAASRDTFAVALGAGSAKAAQDGLGGTPKPVPLMVMRFDYSRFSEIAPDTDAASKAMYAAMGMGDMTLTIDDRGIVSWFSFELK